MYLYQVWLFWVDDRRHQHEYVLVRVVVIETFCFVFVIAREGLSVVVVGTQKI